MNKVLIFFIVFIFATSVFGCSNSNCYQSQKDETIEEFSYLNDVSDFADGEPGVKIDGFKNINASLATEKEQVVSLAKNEVTVEYNEVFTAYDQEQNIWKVTFSMNNFVGGDQAVYIDNTGITKRIVYGE